MNEHTGIKTLKERKDINFPVTSIPLNNPNLRLARINRLAGDTASDELGNVREFSNDEISTFLTSLNLPDDYQIKSLRLYNISGRLLAVFRAQSQNNLPTISIASEQIELAKATMKYLDANKSQSD